jgi:hypothetical protein
VFDSREAHHKKNKGLRYGVTPFFIVDFKKIQQQAHLAQATLTPVILIPRWVPSHDGADHCTKVQ